MNSDIVIFHLGFGSGGIPTLDGVLNQFPRNCILYGFDAQESSQEDRKSMQMYEDRGVRTKLVTKCISGHSGQQAFYVNKEPSSSSLLPPASQALSEDPRYSWTRSWGTNTELNYTVELDAISLGDFIQEEGVIPDLLSMDVQGMEYAIMESASNFFDDIGAVFSEVEFFEIYEGQGLFSHQLDFLRKHDIRLADIVHMQYWHPHKADRGAGFLTVGEALWLRTIDSLDISDKSLIKTIKQAAIGFAYNRTSYASAILNRLSESHMKSKIKEVCVSNGFGDLTVLF